MSAISLSAARTSLTNSAQPHVPHFSGTWCTVPAAFLPCDAPRCPSVAPPMFLGSALPLPALAFAALSLFSCFHAMDSLDGGLCGFSYRFRRCLISAFSTWICSTRKTISTANVASSQITASLLLPLWISSARLARRTLNSDCGGIRRTLKNARLKGPYQKKLHQRVR